MANAEPTLVANLVTTQHGQSLSYYTVGSGPNLLILHGAMAFALTHHELARALSPFYTVHLASRRGRGLSGPYPSTLTAMSALVKSGGKLSEGLDAEVQVGGNVHPRTYNPAFTSALLDVEASDLNALISATNAEFLICVSSGALIALHTLLASTSSESPILRLKRIVIFEPPIVFHDRPCAIDIAGVRRFEEESTVGDQLSAMVTAMRIVQLGPGWIPRPVMRILSGILFRFQDKDVEKRKAQGEEDHGVTTMRGLGTMLRYDFAVVEGMVADASRCEALGDLGGRILLLSGSTSPPYLGQGISVLGEVIPGAKTVIIDGVGHEVLCGREMRGRPELAVSAIREFLQ